jgi:heme a synthase
MPRTRNPQVMRWIIAFGSFAILLVVYGGFVRLTRSGLSIVEWNPVMGAVPPLSQQAWQAEFAKYQTTPEYRQINFNMTLDQYKEIFIIEWIHRILARLAGLVFAIPFFWFLLAKKIPLREVVLYIVMGVLFLSQAVMGWIMVSSGLVDQPAVSHYLLTGHLFLALSLIGLSCWTALGHGYGFPPRTPGARWSRSSRAVLIGLLVLLIQIAYGGLTAGLKAGHVSETWPLMLGRLVPYGLLEQMQPALLNLVAAPVTVVFIHRWFAFLGLTTAIILYELIRRSNIRADLQRPLALLTALAFLQVVLGVSVVLSGVEIVLALLHQFNAICLFIATIFLLHRIRAADFARPDTG